MSARRALLALGLVALGVQGAPAWARETKAQVGVGGKRFGELPSKNYESSQWFAFELKFGPYSPRIDDSPGLNGRTPFSDLFNPQGTTGQPSYKVLTQLELDFQFFHKFGSLGVGGTIGYYRRTTHSFQYASNDATQSCTIGSCVRSGDETALNILPLSLLAVYRFDVLAKRYKVPLVPYFKIGLAYYIWWIEDGGGFLSVTSIDKGNNESASGYGGTFGWVLNPGIAFLLDVIDRPAARVIDSELGINHSYLFCELHYADISGFGASNKLVLSDLTLNAGLAFEF